MKGDASGYKRGAKGYAKGGQWDKDAGTSFGAADFDREKQQGPLSNNGCDGGFDPKPKGKGYRGVDTD